MGGKKMGGGKVCREGVIDSLSRSLELFPKLLSVISAQPHIRHQRGNAQQIFQLYLQLNPSPLLSLQREVEWIKWRVQSSRATF